MKRNRFLFLVCVLALGMTAPSGRCEETNNAPAVQLSDDELGETLQAAVLMARMGLYEEAEEQCRKILAQKPDEPTVKQLLLEIRDKKRQRDPSATLRRKVEDLIIPELNFRNAAVSDVLDFLQEQSRQLSKDKVGINIVWQAPEERKTATVTLNLRQVPLSDVLKYVTESVGLRYRVDAHAVVIFKPLPTPAPNVKIE